MKLKTQDQLFEELSLIERIGHIIVEYGIAKKAVYPYRDWVGLIAWELKMTVEDVEKELEKMYIEPEKKVLI